MRPFIILLAVLFVILQYKLWIEKGSVVTMWHLEKQVSLQQQQNQKLQERNKILEAQVVDLKTGHQAVEELARNELGMIRQGEVFYQVLPPHQAPSSKQEQS